MCKISSTVTEVVAGGAIYHLPSLLPPVVFGKRLTVMIATGVNKSWPRQGQMQEVLRTARTTWVMAAQETLALVAKRTMSGVPGVAR
jgi:hypothetical protein